MLHRFGERQLAIDTCIHHKLILLNIFWSVNCIFLTTCAQYEDVLKTRISPAYLNFGQTVIFRSSVLSTVIVLSSYGVMSGTVVGDLVILYARFVFYLLLFHFFTHFDTFW